MTKELNGMDEHGKCRNCGSRKITYSTEQKMGNWVWKKMCEECNNVLEKQTLLLSG